MSMRWVDRPGGRWRRRARKLAARAKSSRRPRTRRRAFHRLHAIIRRRLTRVDYRPGWWKRVVGRALPVIIPMITPMETPTLDALRDRL